MQTTTVAKFNQDLLSMANELTAAARLSDDEQMWAANRDRVVKARGLNPDDFSHILLTESANDSGEGTH